MNIAAIYGQVTASLALGAGLSLLPIPHRRLLGWAAAVLAMLIIGPTLYGLLGPLSFTLAQIALLRLSGLDVVVAKGRPLVVAFVVFATIFYVLALGEGPFDPFGLGYSPFLILALMLPLALLLAWQGEHILLVIAGLDLLAYGFGLFANLWSALFDPLVVLVAAFRLVRPKAKSDIRADSTF